MYTHESESTEIRPCMCMYSTRIRPTSGLVELRKGPPVQTGSLPTHPHFTEVNFSRVPFVR